MTRPQVGEVYKDTHFRDGSVTFCVMRLSAKSARVEPCEPDGWHEIRGYWSQYWVPFAEFERGRHILIDSSSV